MKEKGDWVIDDKKIAWTLWHHRGGFGRQRRHHRHIVVAARAAPASQNKSSSGLVRHVPKGFLTHTVLKTREGNHSGRSKGKWFKKRKHLR
jgi:hypothetical protein